MTSTPTVPHLGDVTEATVRSYQQRGFARVRGIISPEEAEEYRLAALSVSERTQSLNQNAIFTQLVNVWQHDEVMRRLTLHPNVAAAAERLAGVSLRLWHDHILIKQPHNNAATHFHQDQPYWPHLDAPNSISCWLALCDVPVERGCMTFLPGSHRQTDLGVQNLGDEKSLFSISPELRWEERITVPLKAGDCTFHHSRCAHMATPNMTDEPRVAHVIIFMDRGVRFSGQPHVVTDPLHLTVGDPIEGELFPVHTRG